MTEDVVLKWYGEQATEVLKRAAAMALRICAADLQGKSAKQAPIDKGDLRANCSVGDIREDGSRMSIDVGYDLEYAITQHENLHFRHPKGGKAKYLEDPFKENAKAYARMIDKTVKEALRGGSP